jgi:hypothetical protein
MKSLVVVAFWGIGKGTVEAEDMGVEAGSEARTLPDMLDLGAVEFEFIVSVNLSVGTEIVDFDFGKSIPSFNGLEEALVFCTLNSCSW